MMDEKGQQHQHLPVATAVTEVAIVDDDNDGDGPPATVEMLPPKHRRQQFATIQMFVFLSCLLVTLNQALSSGYFNSVITTIERRFDIPSKMTGLIASTFEIGNLPTVLFVSYFGAQRHVPHWIGKGALVTGLGSLLFAVPHYLPHHSSSWTNSSGHSENFCSPPSPPGAPLSAHAASQLIGGPRSPVDCVADGASGSSPTQVAFFVMAMILVGAGGTPIFTLGTTFIDDHVPKASASLYIGCMYSTVAVGLVAGFLLGSAVLSRHESGLDLAPGHPRFVGSWHLGFIVLGVALLVVAVPFFLFPGPKTKKVKEGAYGKRRISSLPTAMWRLLTNPVFLVTCLGSCAELAIVNGFLVFLPKYLETQFGLGQSQANLFAGAIAVPGACFGIFLGGYLLKRFQLGIKGAIQMVLFFNLVCMGLYTALYFLGCENPKISGLTHPYQNVSSAEDFLPGPHLDAECNRDCGCSPNELEPICGRNGITYFSPCHAGCAPGQKNLTNCACIGGGATSGRCPQSCRALAPFLVLLFVVTLVVSVTQMPLLMVTLRSVGDEERAFALGMQFVLFRLFAYIPSPILFGNVIDSTCLLWKRNCQSSSFCLVYNIEHFRLRYVGTCSALKITAALLFFLDWLLLVRRSGRNGLGLDESMSQELPPLADLKMPSLLSLNVSTRSPDSDYDSDSLAANS